MALAKSYRYSIKKNTEKLVLIFKNSVNDQSCMLNNVKESYHCLSY